MRISDWSSDVCSSDLEAAARQGAPRDDGHAGVDAVGEHLPLLLAVEQVVVVLHRDEAGPALALSHVLGLGELPRPHRRGPDVARLARLHHVVERLHGLLDRSRSEEHTSELQSLMRISYADFCLKKKQKIN